MFLKRYLSCLIIKNRVSLGFRVIVKIIYRAEVMFTIAIEVIVYKCTRNGRNLIAPVVQQRPYIWSLPGPVILINHRNIPQNSYMKFNQDWIYKNG